MTIVDTLNENAWRAVIRSRHSARLPLARSVTEDSSDPPLEHARRAAAGGVLPVNPLQTGGSEFIWAFGIADKPAALLSLSGRCGIELGCQGMR